MSSIKGLVKPVVSVNSQQTVLEAAKLMKEHGRGSLVVMEGNTAVGIITERDFITRIAAENLPYSTQVSQVMSTPLVVVDSDISIEEAARIMVERNIRRLPVIENGKLAGILVSSDFLGRLSKKTLTKAIWAALTGSTP